MLHNLRQTFLRCEFSSCFGRGDDDDDYRELRSLSVCDNMLSLYIYSFFCINIIVQIYLTSYKNISKDISLLFLCGRLKPGNLAII